ncbi:MAG: hypothetical protein ABIR81_05710 [Ginsengibacter sp.]
MTKKLSAVLVVASFVFVGCQKDNLKQSNEVVSVQSKAAIAKETLGKKLAVHPLTLRSGMPVDLQAPSANKRFGTTGPTPSASKTIGTTGPLPKNALPVNDDYSFYRQVVNRAINPADFECAPTEINSYVNASISDWDYYSYVIWYYYGDLANYEAYLLDNKAGGDYYGINGEYTKDLNKTFDKLLGFWDSYSPGIVLTDMHGTIYKDVNKTALLLYILYVDYPTVESAIPDAEFLKEIFGEQQFDNYNHVLFTFNAFAIRLDNQVIPGLEFLGPLPNKIVMGDGILKAFEDLGYGDVAPSAILAHEFGHHIQFENGYFTSEPASPERTRRTELMADAFSAYFLTSKKGGTLNRKRVEQFFKVFFDIGDCGFTRTSHHGTPSQRLRAATFGFNVADQQQKKGQQLTTAAFYKLFEAALPSIIKD